MNVSVRGAARELIVVGILLGVLGLLLYERNAIEGGFLSDAWSNLALYEFAPTSGFWHTLSYFMEQANIAPRPLQAVYLLTLYEVFGTHVGFWLTWQIATNVLMALTLCALLRRLSLGAIDAGIIAALVLIFPAAVSLRFWTPTIWAPLSITLVLFGFLLALSAFEARQRRSRLPLHGISLLLFVASLLLYEVTLPIMLASVLLYRLLVPWREAARRWAVDCLVLIPIVLTVTVASSTGHQETEAGLWAHAQAIFTSSRILFMTIVLPFNRAGWAIVGLVALVPGSAALVYAWLPSGDLVRRELRRWLIVLAAGLLVVGLGYSVFVPGTDYYNPIGPGVADRVNAVPSIGWVLIVYSLIMLATNLVFRNLPRARLLSSGAAALACVFIGLGWIRTVHDYSNAFIAAYAEDTRVLAMIHKVVPEPRRDSTIWTFGQPIEMIPGVPIFGNTWDMTGSVQLEYHDPSLTSLVAQVGTNFYCRRHAVLPGGPYAVEGALNPILASSYGQTYFVDTVTGRHVLIENPRQCRREARTFPRSQPLPVPPSLSP